MCNCTTCRIRKIPGDPKKTSTSASRWKIPGMVLILPSSRIHQPITHHVKRQQAAIGIHQTANAHAQRRLGLTHVNDFLEVRNGFEWKPPIFWKQQKRRVSHNRKTTSFTACSILLVFVRLLLSCIIFAEAHRKKTWTEWSGPCIIQ